MDGITVVLTKAESGNKTREAVITVEEGRVTVRVGLFGTRRHKSQVTQVAGIPNLDDFINEQIVKLVEEGYEVQGDSRDPKERMLFIAGTNPISFVEPEAEEVFEAFGLSFDDERRSERLVGKAGVTLVRRANGQCSISVKAREELVAMPAALIRLLDATASATDSANEAVDLGKLLRAANEAGRLDEPVATLLRKRRLLPRLFDMTQYRTKAIGNPLRSSM